MRSCSRNLEVALFSVRAEGITGHANESRRKREKRNSNDETEGRIKNIRQHTG